jgi:TRAP-type C4-dicarboxylate transport system substrate-binding protein
VTQNNAQAIATLRSNGVTVADVDYPAFRKAVDPVYAAIQAKIGGDLIQRVSRASAEA